MDLLLLNHNVAWSGGTFFRAYHFGREMVRRGHHVTLLTVSPRRRFGFRGEARDGVHVIETPDWLWGRGRTGWDPWDTLQRTRFVRRGRWDVVHAFDSRPAVIAPALIAQRAGASLILDWADWWGRGGTITERSTGAIVRWVVGPLETWFEEAFRTRADGTTVISSALRQRAIALGVSADTIAQIPQGCDIEGITPLDRAWCRRVLGWPARASLVGYLGVLTRSDGRLLFDAYAKLARRRPDCRLVLVGNHRTAVPRDTGIIETGFVDRPTMLQWLGACDLLVLPLRDTIASRGRWPSKLNDYLSAGRAVAATAVGDAKDLFRRHRIGRAVEDSPEALAGAMDALLADNGSRPAMEQAARWVAQHELAWPVLGDLLERHYLAIAGRRGRPAGDFTPQRVLG